MEYFRSSVAMISDTRVPCIPGRHTPRRWLILLGGVWPAAPTSGTPGYGDYDALAAAALICLYTGWFRAALCSQQGSSPPARQVSSQAPIAMNNSIQIVRTTTCWTVLLLGLFPRVSVQAEESAAIAQAISTLIKQHDGDVAVAVRHLKTGESYFHDADELMPTASLIKVAVMVEAYRQSEAGEIDLAKTILLRESDKVPGSGILTEHFDAGTRIPLRTAIHLMIVYSDNTATNLVVDQIGLESVAETMRRLGFPGTQMNSKVYRRSSSSIAAERSKQFGLGSTTAREMLDIFTAIYNGTMISPEASEQMLEHLFRCDDATKIRRDLPSGTRVAHKTGAISHARCDAGVIESPAGPLAIVVLTGNNQDKSWGSRNAAELLCGQIGKQVYSIFNQNPAVAQEAAPAADSTSQLALGATGRLVEDLQRTLNARLDPSPELAIDGDFGPATRGAVIQLQRNQGIAVTGRVDSETWQALGTLVTRDQPVPDPDVINQERLTTEPDESPAGQPFVTAKAWAVADLQSGQLLHSFGAERPLDIASTTKIMTAYLVLALAQQSPEVLDETVTFSKGADETIGSTAGVREGESLSVRELLYGLMLPSGNDAAVALAEHFGDRVGHAKQPSQTERTNLQRFVDAMNEQASHLDMQQTAFRNPHGLTQDGHVSSAQDLVKLAVTAMRIEPFRQIVATRQHGCTVTGPGGYRRNLVWKNTNQLLRYDSYFGVKTGTTSAAGACLVSCSRRGQRELVIVILGSASSKSRYADVRNLYRWAWEQ